MVARTAPGTGGKDADVTGDGLPKAAGPGSPTDVDGDGQDDIAGQDGLYGPGDYNDPPLTGDTFGCK